MLFRQIGSVYLILGTCIAAGMLALPIVTAHMQLTYTITMIVSAWLLMTIGAWCLLQVNLKMPEGTNLISMSHATLGSVVRSITWAVYLFLLYSLICAYVAGSGDILQSLLHSLNLHIPRALSIFIATSVLALIVMRGIHSIDLVNRILMTLKLTVCLLLIFVILPHFSKQNILPGMHSISMPAFMVAICSFGYAIILPSIRVYLKSNRKHLNRVLFIGSLLPMLLYIAWITVIQGAISRYGAHGLIAMNNSPNTNSLLMQQLVLVTHHPILKTFAVGFISVCSITGLLGVSLCLMDFLADGLKREKKGANVFWLAGLTFIPPMIIVMLRPDIFTRALAYAGVCCLYVLIALPVAMYLFGRKKTV